MRPPERIVMALLDTADGHEELLAELPSWPSSADDPELAAWQLRIDDAYRRAAAEMAYVRALDAELQAVRSGGPD